MHRCSAGFCGPDRLLINCFRSAACERNSAAMVAVLLNHGAAVNTRCIQGWTALQESVVRNNVEICEMLLKAGAKLSLTNKFGISPLFSAAQCGQLATLRFLLRHGRVLSTCTAIDNQY